MWGLRYCNASVILIFVPAVARGRLFPRKENLVVLLKKTFSTYKCSLANIRDMHAYAKCAGKGEEMVSKIIWRDFRFCALRAHIAVLRILPPIEHARARADTAWIQHGLF